jgi:hypothetical protein
MRWSELRDDLTLWTIPGARVKNGKPLNCIYRSRRAASALTAETGGFGLRIQHDGEFSCQQLLESEAASRHGNRQGRR